MLFLALTNVGGYSQLIWTIDYMHNYSLFGIYKKY